MAAFATALAISAVAGVALGLVLGMRRFAGEVVIPTLEGEWREAAQHAHSLPNGQPEVLISGIDLTSR